MFESKVRKLLRVNGRVDSGILEELTIYKGGRQCRVWNGRVKNGGMDIVMIKGVK